MTLAIAFLFGAGMPILFPFAFIATFMSANLNKYELAYFRKKPSNYSNKLNMRF